MDLDNAFNINKKTWNDRVAIHAQSDFYKLDTFKKGGSSLNRFELEALGDVSGKSLLHLQCHFGQDTFSFSRLGARCTGVDFSEKAIAFAQNLNKELDSLLVKFLQIFNNKNDELYSDTCSEIIKTLFLFIFNTIKEKYQFNNTIIKW